MAKSKLERWAEKGATIERRRNARWERMSQSGAALLVVDLISPSRGSIGRELEEVARFVETDRDFFTPPKRASARKAKKTTAKKAAAKTRTKAKTIRVKAAKKPKAKRATARKRSSRPTPVVQFVDVPSTASPREQQPRLLLPQWGTY